MPLHFLLDEPASAQPGQIVVLTGQEAHHAATVRRVRVGEIVTVGDGRGVWLTGVCTSISPREVVVEVSSREEVAGSAPTVTLVQALAKGDRDELAVQAATELGVDRIVPWQSARSVSRWDAAKADKGRARWAAIAREASKQSHRAWIPDVSDVVATRALLPLATGATMLVLEPSAPVALTAVPFDGGDDIVLVVGPEGGIAPEELSALGGAGARLVRLGDTVLRTSTAGPAGLAVVNARLGRW
jgi:16S rRNA (uracil1498-N3)-methyltransferase